MIELVYLENGLYVKKLLQKAYDDYLEQNYDWDTQLEFEDFIDRVFKDVINWYSWDMKEDDNCLALLNFDNELAEDLLDSISGLDLSKFEDWSLKFETEYHWSINALVIKSGKTQGEIYLPDPGIYAQSYATMRTNQLTKIARLLNELRISKTGSDSKL